MTDDTSSERVHSTPEHRTLPQSGPVTDFDSRCVISDAERRDPIDITGVVRWFTDEQDIPDTVTLVERVSVYHGPELVVSDGDTGYLITAPGPDSHLLLWIEVTDDDGFRKKWRKIAEVKAALGENPPQYKICDQCGDPIKTTRHERYAALGRCPR